MLDKQVLERLITERALLQYAKENGIKVDDTQVERTIQRIAEDNKLTLDGLRQELAKDNIPYAKYRDDMRNEIIVQRLREREVDSHINVSDAEVDNFLPTIKAQSGGEAEYRSRTSSCSSRSRRAPSRSKPSVAAPRRRSRASAAARISVRSPPGSPTPTTRCPAGNLGWRPAARLPTVFAEAGAQDEARRRLAGAAQSRRDSISSSSWSAAATTSRRWSSRRTRGTS